MNNSIKRLQGQSPVPLPGQPNPPSLQDVYLHRLSSYFSRPKGNPANPIPGGIAPNLMRGQQHFAREVLNRAQIALIEFNYRSDVAARTGDISCLNPIAGAGVAGSNVVVAYDGATSTTITSGETDQVAWAAIGNYDMSVNPSSTDIVGKRRVTWPEAFPHQGAVVAGAAG